MVSAKILGHDFPLFSSIFPYFLTILCKILSLKAIGLDIVCCPPLSSRGVWGAEPPKGCVTAQHDAWRSQRREPTTGGSRIAEGNAGVWGRSPQGKKRGGGFVRGAAGPPYEAGILKGAAPPLVGPKA